MTKRLPMRCKCSNKQQKTKENADGRNSRAPPLDAHARARAFYSVRDTHMSRDHPKRIKGRVAKPSLRGAGATCHEVVPGWQ